MATTAKKPTAKKTKAKTKAASKAAAAKTVEAKTAPKSTDKSVTKQRLYNFNIFAGLANIVFAVLSVVFLSKQTVDVTTAYATKNELAGSGVLGPAYKTLATVEIRYLLAGIFVISAIFSLLLASRLRKNYEAGVTNSNTLIRWVFTGISLGLILEFVTILAGIGDIATLILAGGLIFTTCVLAWMNGRDNKGTSKNYAAFALSMFTGIIAWLPLAGSLKDTYIYGNTNFGWYVYALSAAVLIGFISIARNQYRHAKNGVSAKGYLQLEGVYLSTDFLIKLAVLAIVLIALHK
jgi:hypothetical protein